jgi:hypothetical protein
MIKLRLLRGRGTLDYSGWCHMTTILIKGRQEGHSKIEADVRTEAEAGVMWS